MSLKLAFCDSKAARYAVMNWHYSRRMPLEPLVKVGVWEGGSFVGVVIFGRGAAHNLGDPWGLQSNEVAELVRVALRKHTAPVSKIVSVAIRLFRKSSPGTKMLISFADPEEGHHGGIYQAMNWTYTGRSAQGVQYFHEGRWKHHREVTAGAFGGQRSLSHAELLALPTRTRSGKHRYVLPLHASVVDVVSKAMLPFPKRGSPKGNAGDQPAPGGASPTLPLHPPSDT